MRTRRKFFTEAQRADPFVSGKRVGKDPSLIVDLPNGRIRSLTPEAQKIAAADRDYRLALLQATRGERRITTAGRGSWQFSRRTRAKDRGCLRGPLNMPRVLGGSQIRLDAAIGRTE